MEQTVEASHRSGLWLTTRLVVGVAAWIAAYSQVQAVADRVTYDLVGLERGSHLGEAVAFFLYDVPKIALLLAGIVIVVTVIRSYFPPERVRRVLAARGDHVGTVLAALLGVVTPFCSCSAVPLFIGFVESGVPLGVTFSFLIAAPVVNEVALILLAGLFGWQVALLYVGTGLVVAIVGGTVIGRLGLENQIEEYVRQIKVGAAIERRISFEERVNEAVAYTRDLLGKIMPWVLGGIAIGAGIHGYVPTDFVAEYAGPDNLFAVPLAVLVAIPLYSNAAGTIPVVQALMDRGMPLGTTLAFMMAITAISTPELVILRRVIKPKLIAVFVGVVAVAIVGIGYLFNAVM
ncbi:MAG: permease [Chloroflexi bacterium]|nr:permease [Chloroflexota bacterium]